jgi:hypothetical protein
MIIAGMLRKTYRFAKRSDVRVFITIGPGDERLPGPPDGHDFPGLIDEGVSRHSSSGRRCRRRI